MSIQDDDFQLFPELTGFMSTTFAIREATSPRLYMYFGQMSQSCITHGVTPRRIYTGIDDKYGDYLFSVKAEHNCEVIAVINRCPPRLNDAVQHRPPATLAIVRRLDSEVPYFDVLEITQYHQLHQHYGVRYKAQNMHVVQVGQIIRAGTIIAGPECRLPDGTYMYGTETMLANMSIPEVTEDGGKASREWLQTQKMDCYGKAIIRFSKDEFPLNLYGGDSRYQVLPNIGERVREDGLLFAKRETNPLLAGIQLHPKNLQKLYHTDQCMYVPAGSEIVNISVYRGYNAGNSLPPEMVSQMDDYVSRILSFSEDLTKTHRKLSLQYHGRERYSPRLKALLTEAHAYHKLHRHNASAEVQAYYNKTKVRGYLAVVEYHYTMTPTRGAKFTDSNGAKWVVVSVADRKDMPHDPITGHTADVVMDPNSTVRRTIPGRTTEQYLGASILNMERLFKTVYEEQGKAAAHEMLREYVGIISPPMLELVDDPRHDVGHWLREVRYGRLRLFAPANNPVYYHDVITQLEQRWPVPFGPVTYRGWSGQMKTTKKPVLIGPVYMYALDKDGREFSAVSSASLQSNFGTPAKLAGAAKYSTPVKRQPVRIAGQTELRLIGAACGGQAMAEIVERSNNPEAHRAEVLSLLTHPAPSNMDVSVDFNEVPVTGGRVVQFMKHMLSCQGIRIVHSEEDA